MVKLVLPEQLVGISMQTTVCAHCESSVCGVYPTLQFSWGNHSSDTFQCSPSTMLHKEQHIWAESDGTYCIFCENAMLCSYRETGPMTHGHMTLLVCKCVV